MAEYDLKLVVDADTGEAQRKLDELTGAPKGAGPVPAPSAEAEAAAARVRNVRGGGAGGAGGGREARDFGRTAGDVAGKAIGKAVAGFLAHEVAGVVFSGMKTVGGDNRTVNRAEAAVGGAMKYATMGAMLGGPWGAVIGGVAGAGVGYYQEQKRQEQAAEARAAAIRSADYARSRDLPMQASDQAFGRALDMAGGSERRLAMLRARRAAIAEGEGSWSVKNISETLEGLDPESDRGKAVLANLEAQKQRVASLDMQMLQEGFSNAPGRLGAGDVTDVFARRGISVGSQVDVAQVNDRISADVRDCKALLEKIANMGTDNLHTIGEMQRTVFE